MMKNRSMREVMKRSTRGLGTVVVLGLMASGVCPSVSLAAGPAGVDDAALWLDAAQLGLNNGDTVSSWTDMSGNNNHAALSTGAPKFYTNVLNALPVMRFGTSDMFATANLSAQFPSAATLFIVATVSSSAYNLLSTGSANGEWWRFDGNGYSYPAVFRSPRVENYCVMPTTGTRLFAVKSSASAWQMSIDGRSQGVASGAYSAGGILTIPGNNLGYGHFAGDIAEVIIYNRELSAVDERSVSDYLAAKYGLRYHYTWLNTPASGTWNTTDANWSGDGSVWVNNLNSNKAFFGASTQKAVTIDSVQVQEMNVTADGYSFSGGTLDVKDTLRVSGGCTVTVNSAVSSGIGGGGTVMSANGTLRIVGGTFVLTNSTLTGHMVIGGDSSALIITNGLCNLTRSSDVINSGSHVTVDGSGVLDVRQMRPAQEASWLNASINMNGGTLQANNFGVDLGGYRVGVMNFNGGTLKAKIDTAGFMGGSIWRNSDGSGVKCYVRAGGAIIDSNGKNITIVQPFLSGAASDGGLIKKGLGTLTLSGTNTYVGATAVSNGVLAVTGTYVLPTTTDLYLSTASGAKLQLAFEGTNTVRRFYVNGELQERVKVYSAINRPLVLSGTGFLVVTEGTSGGTLLRLF